MTVIRLLFHWQGFGVAAKSTGECRTSDPMNIVVFHQADIGQYIREEGTLTWTSEQWYLHISSTKLNIVRFFVKNSLSGCHTGVSNGKVRINCWKIFTNYSSYVAACCFWKELCLLFGLWLGKKVVNIEFITTLLYYLCRYGTWWLWEIVFVMLWSIFLYFV